MRAALAFSVHVLTACGTALALLAMLAAARGDWPLMFVFLGVALVVDAVDGPLARAARVSEVLPRWSGDTLDLVVDFTTYVFIPAFVVATASLLPDGYAIVSAAVIVITGTLYFADGNMKTADNFFLGFPAVWNLVVFYLLLLKPNPWVNLAVIALFAILTFVPVRFVHPFRVRRLRTVTVALLTFWAALAVAAVRQGLAPEAWVTMGLCAIALYFLVIGIMPVNRRVQ